MGKLFGNRKLDLVEMVDHVDWTELAQGCDSEKGVFVTRPELVC
jgi:hypothetical protein